MSVPARRGLRAALADGEAMLATFVLIPRVEIVEIIAGAGFQVAIIDCEHGPFGRNELIPLVAAARAAQLYSVVRLTGNSASEIAGALDAGADGVLVPHVGSGEEAAAVVAAARFPPHGQRGANPYVRGARYGADSSYLTDADASAAVLVMVEGARGIAALDEIVTTPGLDGVFVGPVDLSVAMGLAGQLDHPAVVGAVRDVLTRAAAAGLAPSVFAGTHEQAVTWLHSGARLVALSTDTDAFQRALSRTIGDIRTVVTAVGHDRTHHTALPDVGLPIHPDAWEEGVTE